MSPNYPRSCGGCQRLAKKRLPMARKAGLTQRRHESLGALSQERQCTLTKPRPTPCMKKSGRCSESSRSPAFSSERSEEKESPRRWMMLRVLNRSPLLVRTRNSSALLHVQLASQFMVFCYATAVRLNLSTAAGTATGQLFWLPSLSADCRDTYLLKTFTQALKHPDGFARQRTC